MYKQGEFDKDVKSMECFTYKMGDVGSGNWNWGVGFHTTIPPYKLPHNLVNVNHYAARDYGDPEQIARRITLALNNTIPTLIACQLHDEAKDWYEADKEDPITEERLEAAGTTLFNLKMEFANELEKLIPGFDKAAWLASATFEEPEDE